MANKNPSQLTAWTGSIDIANDLVMVWKNSNSTLYKATPNQLANLTSQWVGRTDTQTLQNKTLDNTTALTIKDGSLTLQNTSDPTKQVVLALSNSTGTTRTLTLPATTDTLVGRATTDTLTNKTLTAPAISGGTIDNSTITVDAIAGHTSATIVTVAGLNISAGVLNTDNSVKTSNIQDTAVTNAKLAANVAWSSWTPSWTNVTVGDATITARYQQIGKTVFFRLIFQLGTTTAITGVIRFSLPVNPASGLVVPNATVWLVNSGVENYSGFVRVVSANTLDVYTQVASGTYVADSTATSATVPFTWGSTDAVSVSGSYEAA